ncbi:hypothetical protein [Bifidobacterium callitrichidarum]|uniref:GtrA-like protein domain-containing protein n=1 Tax=Bifidobacterium callitrichidarum TaxID=2052941 RepID=A0A2U2NB30_9BIFI|nr:hypothetical protein [Bifidobacterium callitrichidarum]PWG66351.1 hypothetical protein DF196_04005 [Bifidobacterium callitrichidarum]
MTTLNEDVQRTAVPDRGPIAAIRRGWARFDAKHHGIAEFIMFFIVCNAVTVLQLVLMPVFKWLFGLTPLVATNFQVLSVGHNFDGSAYYVFDYAAGAIGTTDAAGVAGGGGLAYFLAVELTMAIAQVINFITQRKVTFKSTGSVWKAAAWYVLAYVIITIGAAALQGLYKAPLYGWCIDVMGAGAGATTADLITMIINCTLSFWVFYPIMKLIFKQK